MQERYPKVDGPLEQRRKPLRDVDAAERAFRVRAAVWLGPALLVLGAFAGLGAGGILGLGVFASLLVGLAVALGGAVFFVVLYELVGGGGLEFLGDRLYGGSGTSGTPLPKTYWRADALAMQGRRAEALQALEAAALEDPGDPGPCLRAAALCLEEGGLEEGGPEEGGPEASGAKERGDRRAAVEWYRRARAAERTDAETDAYIGIRLAELHEALGAEGRAMAELRRLLDLHPDSRYAARARARLTALKAEWADEISNSE